MYSFYAADCAFRVKPFVCSLSLLAKGIVLAARRINFNEQKLEIRQALWDGQLVAPKRTGSVRTIYFGTALSLALSVQFQNSIHSAPEDVVFCRLDGSPLNPGVLRRDVLYPILDRLGISRTSWASGFRTFRHSAASIVNHETRNLKLAQRFLGHSNLSTTADVYTHTSAEAERSAARALEQEIYGNLFHRLGTRTAAQR